MPVESKPLFRPDVLRKHVAPFVLPEQTEAARAKLQGWAKLFAAGGGQEMKEKELLPQFLTDVFRDLLGYTEPAEAEVFTFRRETHVEVAGTFPDGVLGRFGGGDANRVTAVIEGKGPKDPLERPHGGRKVSAVDQAYDYAINLRCEWIVVTSMRWTRLYCKGADKRTYESFALDRLASDELTLRRFVFLLGAERMVRPDGSCHLTDLLAASEAVGSELTKEFYGRYADMRRTAFRELRRENPAVPPSQVLQATQKLLDRVLFCAFCEDRGLLPPDTIKQAYLHSDAYNPKPVWENFRGLFRAIDGGSEPLRIPAYNGGLFAHDPVLETLRVSDRICGFFKELGDYDYRRAADAAADLGESFGGRLVDVEVLGHIFEQSIVDLERLRGELDVMASAGTAASAGEGRPDSAGKVEKSRRKKEGAFYTPAFITRYIVEQALGGVLKERFAALREKHRQGAKGAAKTALADPEAYDLATLGKGARETLARFWEAWQDELATVRIVDPACGSGAFLIEAFDRMYIEYQTSNARIEELRGARSLFEADRRILQNNLYGVDLNPEAVEICRLSLWIKTAARGKTLTSLDHTIREGNSVVADVAAHPKAFDWQAAFPEVFAAGRGGFDVVIGNPPYVRQELLTPFKPYLERSYASYHGMADLYVYFYELGIGLLRPGGLLSYIVTNKWMKAAYGEPLRKFFAAWTWVESVVDFGHAKQIFEDADVFPCILVARKPTPQPPPATARLCTIPREQLRIDDLSRQIADQGADIALDSLRPDGWQLEPDAVSQLLEKIKSRGVPLTEFAGVAPNLGIKTGLNEAFIIDAGLMRTICAVDPSAAAIMRPNIRGQDFARWHPDGMTRWMIALKSSENHVWPWSNAGEHAEAVFRATYPSIHAHFLPLREDLIRRQDQGRFWWELRSCAYWGEFDRPKLMYPDIAWRPEWCLDLDGSLCNNTVYFLPSSDLWILAVLNSPLGWWFAWRRAVHGKDEALRYFKDFVQDFPIASPTPAQRTAAEERVGRLIELQRVQGVAVRDLLDWLRVEHEIAAPSQKLKSPLGLDSDAFVAEVKKGRGRGNPLTSVGLKNLRDEYAASIAPARGRAAEIVQLERETAELVEQAFGLTPEEVALMWQTAPPRMPIAPPDGSA